MASMGVQFQPKIENFGDLNLRAATAKAAVRAPGISSEQRRATIHFLAGFVFILGFITLLSALYVADQSVFEPEHIVTASQPMVTDINASPIDYN